MELLTTTVEGQLSVGCVMDDTVGNLECAAVVIIDYT